MAITRPTADQLTFRSSANGVQNLDIYLEEAERGGRRLGDLLSDLFDTSGQFANDAFQFRVNSTTRQLQVRVGTFTDPGNYGVRFVVKDSRGRSASTTFQWVVAARKGN